MFDVSRRTFVQYSNPIGRLRISGARGQPEVLLALRFPRPAVGGAADVNLRYGLRQYRKRLVVGLYGAANSRSSAVLKVDVGLWGLTPGGILSARNKRLSERILIN